MPMTHYMELLATNQPWNLILFMAIPVVLAETVVITEFGMSPLAGLNIGNRWEGFPYFFGIGLSVAISTLVAVLLFWISARGKPMPARLTTGVHALLAVTVLQVVLGIMTLVMRVPVHLAATHQAVAVLVFTAALYLCHGFRRSGP